MSDAPAATYRLIPRIFHLKCHNDDIVYVGEEYVHTYKKVFFFKLHITTKVPKMKANLEIESSFNTRRITVWTSSRSEIIIIAYRNKHAYMICVKINTILYSITNRFA
jgi:hypothetical protein